MLWIQIILVVLACVIETADGKQRRNSKYLKVILDWNKSRNARDTTDSLKHREQSRRASSDFRPGHPTTTNSCQNVRAVPSELRSPAIMRPDGLDDFYQKYTEAYGIPVLGSVHVSDDALRRACYTLRFLLADHAGVRDAFYRVSGRVAIMAATEVTLDIPEHSHMDVYWNDRSRGLGATISSPLSTGAEENVLCLANDRYHREDIFLHELSHGVASLGAEIVIPGWIDRLRQTFQHAQTTGLWANTYALTNAEEYFAEGVQSFFNVNDFAEPTNGIHNNIDTQAELRPYDSKLYDLIMEVFPCNNPYLKPCGSTRQNEQAQVIRMNCNTDNAFLPESSAECSDDSVNCLGWAASGECENNPGYMLSHCQFSCNRCQIATRDCTDSHENCQAWANSGECNANPGYMLVNCKHSCNHCDTPVVAGCTDSNEYCESWATSGECTNNPAYMLVNCKRSCNHCDGHEPTEAQVLRKGQSMTSMCLPTNITIARCFGSKPQIHSPSSNMETVVMNNRETFDAAGYVTTQFERNPANICLAKNSLLEAINCTLSDLRTMPCARSLPPGVFPDVQLVANFLNYVCSKRDEISPECLQQQDDVWNQCHMDIMSDNGSLPAMPPGFFNPPLPSQSPPPARAYNTIPPATSNQKLLGQTLSPNSTQTSKPMMPSNTLSSNMVGQTRPTTSMPNLLDQTRPTASTPSVNIDDLENMICMFKFRMARCLRDRIGTCSATSADIFAEGVKRLSTLECAAKMEAWATAESKNIDGAVKDTESAHNIVCPDGTCGGKETSSVCVILLFLPMIIVLRLPV